MPQRFAELAAVWLLAVSAVGAPACLGASGIWPRWALEAVAAMVAVLWATCKPRPMRVVIFPLAMAGVGLLQLIPIPDSLLVKVAPISAGAWKVALAGSGAAAGCISVDPGTTLTAIRRLLLAVATVAVVSDIGRQPHYRTILTRAVATSGILILAAAMIFGRGREDFTMMSGLLSLRGPIHPLHSPLIMPVQSSGIGTIDRVTVGNAHYLVDSPHTGDGCGLYIYSNHFAGAVALTLPMLIAVWLGASHARLPAAIGPCGALGLYCLGLWAVGWLADSKAGFASLILAGLTLAALAAVRPWARRLSGLALITTTIVGLLTAALLLGPFQAAVIQALPESGQRIAVTLISANGRMMATAIGLRMFRASPLLGTGLGSYQSLFPRFHQGNSTFFYAHSDWAQLLAECGLVGAITAFACGWTLAWRGWLFYRDCRPPERLIDAGAWAAVAGITFYSAFDWNLHLPANALLACIVFGLAASSVPRSVSATLQENTRLRIAAQTAFSIACLTSLALLTRDAVSETTQRKLNQAIIADRIAATKPEAPARVPLLLAATAAGKSASAFDQRNSRLLVLMGQANLHLAARTEDPTTRTEAISAANQWFSKAQRANAVCRGLPDREVPSR